MNKNSIPKNTICLWYNKDALVSRVIVTTPSRAPAETYVEQRLIGGKRFWQPRRTHRTKRDAARRKRRVHGLAPPTAMPELHDVAVRRIEPT
jgi:hypothetical protein